MGWQSAPRRVAGHRHRSASEMLLHRLQQALCSSTCT
jgi:hypothetical protein